MSKQKLTYNEASDELERILAELENDKDLTMDALSEKVKRATILLDVCKKLLHELDRELEKIMEQIE